MSYGNIILVIWICLNLIILELVGLNVGSVESSSCNGRELRLKIN
jgi:hypothetical protein